MPSFLYEKAYGEQKYSPREGGDCGFWEGAYDAQCRKTALAEAGARFYIRKVRMARKAGKRPPLMRGPVFTGGNQPLWFIVFPAETPKI